MSHPTNPQSLIEELDARQNQVLEQLEQLNARVEQAIKECLDRVAEACGNPA